MAAIARRSDFEQFLRTGGRLPGRLELKFNPNHDPATGRFTSASGGGRGVGKMPFSPHTDERPIDREVSAKLNRLATDPHATESLTVAGAPMTFSRTGPNTIIMHASALGGSMTMEGHYTTNTNQMDITLSKPQLDGTMRYAQVSSYPTNITVIRARSGRMVYSLNRALDAGIGIFGKTRGIHSAAGAHYFGH